MRDDLLDELVDYVIKSTVKLEAKGYPKQYSIHVASFMLMQGFWAVRNETHIEFKDIIKALDNHKTK